jgi:hypothetical protein
MYNWIISQMDTVPEANGLTDIVSVIHWRCNLEEEPSIDAYGTVVLHELDSDNFVEFEDLSEEQVINWVKSSLGNERITQITESLNSRLQNKLNPKTVVKHVPW